ncbi:MAG: transposase, partial [Thermoplasmatales archaeon]|nr:transposase [Thermoplasmatales archaeon]
AITEGDVNDSSLFEDFIEHIPAGSTIYGDKAYFSRKNYNIAEKKGIIFHSPPKKNALAKCKS